MCEIFWWSIEAILPFNVYFAVLEITDALLECTKKKEVPNYFYKNFYEKDL